MPSFGGRCDENARMVRHERLLVLDCDGVLVDSESLSVELDRTILREVGWPLSAEEIVERFTGRTHAFFVAEIEHHLGRPLPEGFSDDYRRRSRELFEERLRPVPGVIDALDRIPGPTCVASSGSMARMRVTLGLTGLWDRFEGRIFSAVDVGRGKPAPDVFLHAARSLGFEPASCIVVEDSVPGLTAARAAGMAAIGFGGSVVPATALAPLADVVVEHMSALPDAVDSLRPAAAGGAG